MKRWTAILFVVLSSLAFAETGKISGTVVDESGVPVPHLIVEAFPLDTLFDVRLPHGFTDEHGHFSITVSTIGSRPLRWRVYPCDESKFYPELSDGFYQTDENQPTIVRLDDTNLEATIQMRVGRKAGALIMTVSDAAKGASLGSVRYELARADDANKYFRIETGGYPRPPERLLLPSNIDVTLSVSSPGYQPWTYPGVINVGPGQDLPLDIQLLRANTPSR